MQKSTERTKITFENANKSKRTIEQGKSCTTPSISHTSPTKQCKKERHSFQSRTCFVDQQSQDLENECSRCELDTRRLELVIRENLCFSYGQLEKTREFSSFGQCVLWVEKKEYERNADVMSQKRPKAIPYKYVYEASRASKAFYFATSSVAIRHSETSLHLFPLAFLRINMLIERWKMSVSSGENRIRDGYWKIIQIIFLPREFTILMRVWNWNFKSTWLKSRHLRRCYFSMNQTRW